MASRVIFRLERRWTLELRIRPNLTFTCAVTRVFRVPVARPTTTSSGTTITSSRTSSSASRISCATRTSGVRDRCPFRRRPTTPTWWRSGPDTTWSRRSTTRAKDLTRADAPRIGRRAQWLVQLPYTQIPKKLCTLLKVFLLYFLRPIRSIWFRNCFLFVLIV